MGGGLVSLLLFPLQGFRLVTTGFQHEKCPLLLVSRGHFLCAVMSNPLQNYECNISPRTVSHAGSILLNIHEQWPHPLWGEVLVQRKI